MKPLSSKEIKGTWATLLLPIAEDDSIDWARLGDEIDFLVGSGVDGIYSNGTAREFYAESEDEFDRIQDILARKCEKAAIPFQIGASHPSPSAQASLERLRRAVSWKPGAIQVILPDWFSVNEREAPGFLEKMAEAEAPIGLVLCNPAYAKRIFTRPELGALARSDLGLVGI
jgi:dihydrodipicolinate synthase/N-acetylneuraminate lyase